MKIYCDSDDYHETMNNEENDDLMIYGDFNGEIGLELDKLFQTNSQWFQDWGSPCESMASHCKSYRQFKPWKCVVHQPTRFYRSTCLNQQLLFEGTQGQPICEPWGAQVDAEFEEQLAADIDELRAVSRAKAMVGCCVTDDFAHPSNGF